ncbi:phage terminase large subunit [Brevundimonas nasdae]|uniref:phage terminase large subunit n=1 Tax=Brevundimonas nasdae TaxID=172043 RepID=UPI0039775611
MVYVWKAVLRLPKPTRVQLDIAAFLASGGTRRMIQAFRGVGKSFLTCAYVVWRLWRDPQLKILIVSKSEESAKESANLIMAIIWHEAGDDLWSELRPSPEQRASILSFDVGPAIADKQPSVKALGIGGQLPGNRADIIIPDDIEVLGNADTEHARQKLMDQATEFEAIIKPTDEAEITYLGTPQTVMSVYSRLPEKGYDIRVWPARYPARDRLHRYGNRLAPMLVADIEKWPAVQDCDPDAAGGQPTCSRFDELQLSRREVGMKSAKFALQYMLDTALSDSQRYPLKCRDLIVMDVPRKLAPVSVEWASGPAQLLGINNVGLDGDSFYRPMFYSEKDLLPYTGAVMTIDPSGRGKDETAYCVTKFLKGMIYVRRWGGFQDGHGVETLEALAKIAKEEEVTAIQVEGGNMGGSAFAQLLQPVVNRLRPCRIEEKSVPRTRKEERIIAVLEPVMKQHRLVMDTRVIDEDGREDDVEKRGLFQMTRMMDRTGALQRDDRIDALAQSVAYWTEYLDADTKKSLSAHEAKKAREEDRIRWKGTAQGRRDEASRNPIKRGQSRPMRRR